VGLVRPTVTVLFGRGSWFAKPPAPTDAYAVYCIPCQGSTWSAANKYHGLGQTGISSNLGLMRVKAPGAFTLTDIRVELTGVMGGGGGSTIAWSLNVNDVTDTTVVATVTTGESGNFGSGELAIAEGDVLVLEAVRSGSPPSSVAVRGVTLGYKVAL
jgi:hypothetical protein